jgi:hypothetical protein
MTDDLTHEYEYEQPPGSAADYLRDEERRTRQAKVAAMHAVADLADETARRARDGGFSTILCPLITYAASMARVEADEARPDYERGI